MNAVTFKQGVPGYQCGDCDSVFVEPVEVEVDDDAGEARGAVETRTALELRCPECDSTDLESIHVCTTCRELPANDGPHCGVCAPPVVDTEQEGGFRRDLTHYEKAVTGIDPRARDQLIAGLRRSQP